MAKKKTPNPAKKVEKVNAVESERRAHIVYDLLVDGYTRYEIIKYCGDNWGIEKSQVDVYISKAKEIITAFANEEDKTKFLEKAKTRFEKLHKMALAKKDYRAAAKIQETANKVLGYEKLNLEHSGEINITDEEYNQRLNKHLAEREQGHGK